MQQVLDGYTARMQAREPRGANGRGFVSVPLASLIQILYSLHPRGTNLGQVTLDDRAAVEKVYGHLSLSTHLDNGFGKRFALNSQRRPVSGRGFVRRREMNERAIGFHATD
jgi:hypothetical protein